MPDKRQHRGPNPRDRQLFAPQSVLTLQQAAADYCTLLDMGYPKDASLKLVGDRFELKQRQRMAIARSSCTAEEAEARRQKEVPANQIDGRLEIDGFNLLITVESALSGGVIIIGRDGAYRDIASQHGTFHSVAETGPALNLIGKRLADAGPILWLLDRPVSNSGRLKQQMLEIAANHSWDWQVELVQNPDEELRRSTSTIVTADSVILDHCDSWVNLAKAIIHESIPDAQIVEIARQD